MRTALVAVLGVGLSTACEAAESGPAKASFVDRFTRLDEQRWSISDGWSGGAQYLCTLAGPNIHVENGVHLALTPQAYKNHPYSCAELQSRDFYGYGTYEVRMRAAAGSGVVSAFFTYTGPYYDRPQDEIDFEFLGRDTHSVQLNFFSAGQGGHEKLVDLGFDAVQAANDYAIEWRRDRIRWYVNGRLVQEVAAGSGNSLPRFPGKIFLDIWNSNTLTDWLGPYTPVNHPQLASYELVAFTVEGAPCQFPQSIVCRQP